MGMESFCLVVSCLRVVGRASRPLNGQMAQQLHTYEAPSIGQALEPDPDPGKWFGIPVVTQALGGG